MENKNKLPQRFGVLEVEEAKEDGTVIFTCLAHPGMQQPLYYMFEDLKRGFCCPQCMDDASKLPSNVIRMVGKQYKNYVAIRNVGLSPAGQRSSHHPFWRCFCILCHRERNIRADVLRNGKPPLCKCMKKGSTNEGPVGDRTDG